MLNFLKNKWLTSGKYSPEAIKATNQSFSLSRILYGLRHIHAVFAGSVWFTRNRSGLRQIFLVYAKSIPNHTNISWFLPNRRGLRQILLDYAKSYSNHTNVRWFTPNRRGLREIHAYFADRCDPSINSFVLGLNNDFYTIRLFYRCCRQ